jgi:predicted transposase YdaD
VAKPFDATLKDLVEKYPGDWLVPMGLSAIGPVTVIDADLSTITTQADKIIRVDDPEPWLMHLDLQAGYDPHLDRRSLKYNVLAHDRHELPVHTVIVLLRPQANAPNLTGIYRYRPPHSKSEVQFLYQIIRLWELPVEAIMAGGLGTLPLAPLCKVGEAELPIVISRMEQRIRAEAPAAELPALWTSTYILMGLRYPPEVAAHLLRGVRDMKESSTYQAILDEGSMTEARRLLLLQGTERFGPPDARTRRAIERARSIGRLEKLMLRLLTVSSWQELLNPPRQ